MHASLLLTDSVTTQSPVQYSLNTKTNSQVAVLFSVDSETVMFLSKAVPDMLTHTETKPSVSLAIKGSENPTNRPVREEINVPCTGSPCTYSSMLAVSVYTQHALQLWNT